MHVSQEISGLIENIINQTASITKLGTMSYFQGSLNWFSKFTIIDNNKIITEKRQQFQTNHLPLQSNIYMFFFSQLKLEHGRRFLNALPKADQSFWIKTYLCCLF